MKRQAAARWRSSGAEHAREIYRNIYIGGNKSVSAWKERVGRLGVQTDHKGEAVKIVLSLSGDHEWATLFAQPGFTDCITNTCRRQHQRIKSALKDLVTYYIQNPQIVKFSLSPLPNSIGRGEGGERCKMGERDEIYR